MNIRDSLPKSNKSKDEYIVYRNYLLTDKILELTKCRVGGWTIKFYSELSYQSAEFLIYRLRGDETGVR